MGTKCSKSTFLENGKILTTGFSKHSDRQYAIWDQHDLKKPLAQEIIDSSSGIITPYFDYDTKMVSGNFSLSNFWIWLFGLRALAGTLGYYTGEPMESS